MPDADASLDFEGLRALFVNGTLKPSPKPSHTEGLIEVSRAIMEKHGIACETLRAVDLDLAPGVGFDMREEGFETDDGPRLVEKVLDAHILVLTTPIWLGEKSSVITAVIERLYGASGRRNDAGQYLYYGRTGGVLITGNEDGAKHCAASVLYALSHLGFVVPPQADAYWVGEAGPGPSYLDEGSGGPQNAFTQRNVVFLTWNLMHMARLLRDAGGFPAHGNQAARWEKGEHFDHPSF